MKKTLCGEIEGEYCVRFLLYLLLHSNKKILQKQLGTDFTLFRCGSKVHIFIPEGWLRAIVEKEKRVCIHQRVMFTLLLQSSTDRNKRGHCEMVLIVLSTSSSLLRFC